MMTTTMRLILRSGLLLLILSGSVDSFNSRLERPWEKPKGPNPAVRGYSRKKQLVALFYTDPNRNFPTEGNTNSKEADDPHGQSKAVKHVDEFASSLLRTLHYTTTTLTSAKPNQGPPLSSSPMDVGSQSPEPHILDYREELIAMSRPKNLPGVVLFHIIGSCLAFRHFESVAATAASTTTFWQLLASPPMMVTLLALLLVSSTSMLVNDYYDYKLGNDSGKPGKMLQKIPPAVVKKTLSYLYAISLFCAIMVPGIPGRVAVIGGLILTFLYTKHVKPRTWAKNALCASLISLSPLTSGVAATSVLSSTFSSLPFVDVNWPLVRLVSLLFVGILGREISMDINDFEDDSAHSVRTVPVVYGPKFASNIAFVCSFIVAGLAVSEPWLGSLDADVTIRRAALAGVGSMLQLRRYWIVVTTEGQDSSAIDVAVDEGLLSIVLILASFI